MSELINGRWPLWFPPQDPDTDPGGYGRIARFVTPGIIAGELSFRPANRQSLKRQTGLSGAALDQVTVQGIWDGLVGQQIAYDRSPWHTGEGQPIRDPESLLRRASRSAGTCIDLSLLFAAACLNEELDTYLLMLRGRDKAHAAVAIRLACPSARDADERDDRLSGRAVRPTGIAGHGKSKPPGVLAVADRSLLAEAAVDEGLLLIDVTAATSTASDTSLEEAQRRAWAALSGSDYLQFAHLVDVALRQYGCGDASLPLPTRRGALRGRVAPPETAPVRYVAHETARAKFADASGKFVITGVQGTGKSTLAREIAVLAGQGRGWFLPAAGRVSFETALAASELGERGEPARILEDADRGGLARDALDRLGRLADDWVIVLDNANDGAAPFDQARAVIDRLPDPQPGQLIIATSTAGPNQWPGWTAVELPTVSAAELAEHGDALAARLSAGRPLLMTAFSSLFAADEQARDGLGPGPEAGPETADDAAAGQAAARYWAALRASLERAGRVPRGTAAIGCGERLAWLPPDRIEPSAVGASPAVIQLLAARGLLTRSATARDYALHRLFGEAIRSAAGNRAEPIVRALLADGAARRSLLQHGDADVSHQLSGALSDSSDGQALAALGALQEVYEAKTSAGTYARAAGKLDPADPEQARAFADALHAAGRVVNQKRKDETTPAEVAAAIDDMNRAIALRPQEETVEIAKHLALAALLRQRAARYLTDPEQKRAELHEAMQAFEDSWKLRREVLGDADPLVDRAYYNRAGIRVTLAQNDPANAARYLREAEEVYRTTAAFRRRYYNGPNPITAAAVNGIGIVGYYQVLYDLVNTADTLLEEAINAANEALVMRRQTSIAGDIVKSSELLLKLSVLQAVFASAKEAPGHPTGRDLTTGQAPAALGEVTRELALRTQVLAQLGVTAERLTGLGLPGGQIRRLGLEPPEPGPPSE
jgi:hypothetical protein